MSTAERAAARGLPDTMTIGDGTNVAPTFRPSARKLFDATPRTAEARLKVPAATALLGSAGLYLWTGSGRSARVSAEAPRLLPALRWAGDLRNGRRSPE